MIQNAWRRNMRAVWNVYCFRATSEHFLSIFFSFLKTNTSSIHSPACSHFSSFPLVLLCGDFSPNIRVHTQDQFWDRFGGGAYNHRFAFTMKISSGRMDWCENEWNSVETNELHEPRSVADVFEDGVSFLWIGIKRNSPSCAHCQGRKGKVHDSLVEKKWGNKLTFIMLSLIF